MQEQVNQERGLRKTATLHLEPPLMLRKTQVNIILLLSTFPLCRLWHAFGLEKTSLWLQRNFYFPIEERWYYKILSEHLAFIVLSILIVRAAKMRKWYEVAAVVHLCYRLYDLGAFFYNFNRTDDYVVAYSFAGLIAAIYYFFRHEFYRLRGLQNLFRRKINAG